MLERWEGGKSERAVGWKGGRMVRRQGWRGWRAVTWREIGKGGRLMCQKGGKVGKVRGQ